MQPVTGRQQGNRRSSALSKRSLAVEVDGQRVPAAVLGYLGVHHEILNLDLAKSIDGVGHPPQERRYVSLALTSRIGLAEVLYDPRRPLAHPSSLPSRVRSCRDDGRLAAVGACYVLTGLAPRPAASAGRLLLMTGGVATVLVTASPEPAGGGGSLPHTAPPGCCLACSCGSARS